MSLHTKTRDVDVWDTCFVDSLGLHLSVVVGLLFSCLVPARGLGGCPGVHPHVSVVSPRGVGVNWVLGSDWFLLDVGGVLPSREGHFLRWGWFQTLVDEKKLSLSTALGVLLSI